MLQQQHRLKKMKVIEILMKQGRFVGGKLLTVKIWKINPDKFPRRNYSKDDLLIGFSIGKKISKSAVKRNFYKRKIREAVRLLLKEKEILPGAMVMIIAKSEIKEATYKEIETEVSLLLKKIKIIK